MPGPWGHLAARFVDVVTSRPLSRGEVEAVEKWLEDERARQAFFSQIPADQRHGFESALIVVDHAPQRLDLIRAALLHDVGKRHARLSPLGRVIASVAIRFGLPLTPRLALYRDHGAVAAAEFADEDPLVVEFARHHHGDRPASIEVADWEILQAADQARPIREGSR